MCSKYYAGAPGLTRVHTVPYADVHAQVAYAGALHVLRRCTAGLTRVHLDLFAPKYLVFVFAA